MTGKRWAILLALLLACLPVAVWCRSISPLPRPAAEPAEEVHIAFAACGDRIEEALVMVKSAVLFTRGHLTFHIFADDTLRPQFQERLAAWPERARQRFTVELYPISYPGVEDVEKWRALFKPCATQRLFMPYLVRGTERALYVDTDILFLRPPEEVWRFFGEFAPEQLAALAPETESAGGSWYARFAKHPFYAPHGMNSGVMLMHFARMRERRWRERMIDYRARFSSVPWGDQDLINIYFHDSPEELLVFPCDFNYRPDHCRYGSDCRPAEVSGPSILHGNRQAFHTGKIPLYKAIYDAFDAFDLSEPREKLLGPIEAALAPPATGKDGCNDLADMFGKRLARELSPPRDGAERGADDDRDMAAEQLDPWRRTGITAEDVDRLRKLGPRVVRYQILGGRLYRDAKCPPGARCPENERILARLAPGLPDVEFFVDAQAEAMPGKQNRLPVFSAVKLPLDSADILYPTWTGDESRDALAAGAEVPWDRKEDTVFFRGPRLSKIADPFVALTFADGALWDARFTRDGLSRNGEPPPEELGGLAREPTTAAERCSHRYLLHFDGGDETSRLKDRLACGAVVLYIQPRRVELYSSRLLAWRHYIPIEREADDAERALEMLRDNSVLPRQIAENARAFVEERLTAERAEGAWKTLLLEYAKLQRFVPARDESLIAVGAQR